MARCTPAARQRAPAARPECCARGRRETRAWLRSVHEGRTDRTWQGSRLGEVRGQGAAKKHPREHTGCIHRALQRAPLHLMPLTSCVTPCTASPSCAMMLPTRRCTCIRRPSGYAKSRCPPSHAPSSVSGTCATVTRQTRREPTHSALRALGLSRLRNRNQPAPCVRPCPCGS